MPSKKEESIMQQHQEGGKMNPMRHLKTPAKFTVYTRAAISKKNKMKKKEKKKKAKNENQYRR